MALPSLYEHYTAGGITGGLSVNQPYFTLNDKNISLYGGSMHYFRVHPQYWRDRLRKMRAAGLNAVQTYVPWNLHEPQPGKYDFGKGGTDMEEFLDVEKFLKTAQEEDLFVIMRPGPFICAEFEFGGMPSWLLREPNIKFRTSDEVFMKYVTNYFMVLLSLLAPFQFTKGGPIISFQVENEYGSTGQTDPPFTPDKVYIEQLRQLFLTNNITELLFTSDSPVASGSSGSLQSLFQTANFGTGDPAPDFDKLKELQGDKPAMATEYWSGWFDHWSQDKYNGSVRAFADTLDMILAYPASVNFYMFHGGTSWGFLNGANMDSLSPSTYYPDTTSYDYDAPLTESGDYHKKYQVVKQRLEDHDPVKTRRPQMPELKKRVAYDSIKVKRYINYEKMVDKTDLDAVQNDKILPMEMLPINNNTGQQFGYIIYRKTDVTLPKGSKLTVTGYVYDTINVYVNGKRITNNVNDLDNFGYWRQQNGSITFTTTYNNAVLDLIVCNMGRNNFGSLDQFYQFKGLKNPVLLDDKELTDWHIIPMEFKRNWIENLSNWDEFDNATKSGAGLYEADLIINDNGDDIADTYVDMSKWKKGIVMVNGFVLGRYWTIGPQQSLYLPGPLLKVGVNKIVIFEEFSGENQVDFLTDPIYFNNSRKPRSGRHLSVVLT
ncbi:unnamed protein product [Phyllotreta striolata]|uniref:Beta-galactosidase n=1 Tax=Phyllotreta striolata TaxID=444603 RepID=A0A9N9TPU6_PHYSR|nr:unnamed protein product [Phyllotreta striolata]